MPEHLRPRLSRAAKRVLRSPSNALVASSDELAARIRSGAIRSVGENPALAARFAPYRGGMESFVLNPTDAELGSDGLPVPSPRMLAEGYPDNAEEYITSGQQHVRVMLDLLREAGKELEPSARVLEFGCAAGRALRHLTEVAESGEVWGVDIRADQILWCQQHLSPPFRFFTSTTFPYLPFQAGHFDLVFAMAIFTDVFELTDFWLLELRRLLDPEGCLYLTVHDAHSIDLIMGFDAGHPLAWLRQTVADFDAKTPFIGGDFDVVSISNRPTVSYTFYNLDFLRRTLERLGFRILAVREEAQWFLTGLLIAPA